MTSCNPQHEKIVISKESYDVMHREHRLLAIMGAKEAGEWECWKECISVLEKDK